MVFLGSLSSFLPHSQSHESVDSLKKALGEAAATVKGQALFVWINTDIEDHLRYLTCSLLPSARSRLLRSILEFFSIPTTALPAIRAIKVKDKNNIAKFKFEGEITAASVTTFINGVLSGSVEVFSRCYCLSWFPFTLVLPSQRRLNSEEIPEDWDANGVKVVVGKNFEQVVINSDATVFVEFCTFAFCWRY